MGQRGDLELAVSPISPTKTAFSQKYSKIFLV